MNGRKIFRWSGMTKQPDDQAPGDRVAQCLSVAGLVQFRRASCDCLEIGQAENLGDPANWHHREHFCVLERICAVRYVNNDMNDGLLGRYDGLLAGPSK